MKVKRVIALGVCCMAVLSGCQQNVQQQVEQNYPLMTVKPEDRELSVSYSAVIEGKQDVEIRPQVSGTITQVLVKEGAHVRKGQVLFVIDQVPYKAALQKRRQLLLQLKQAKQLQSRRWKENNRCSQTR